MILNFTNVKVKNFMSFEQAAIDLSSNQGFISITGENNNKEDLAISNGAGKSAIWEALVWGLTGSTIRGNKRVVRTNSDGECAVTAEFEVDGNQYAVTRIGGVKSNLLFFVNGEDKSGKGIRDTTKILNEYLPGITANLLGSVIIMGQGLPTRFSNNTPSGRKEVLEKLVNADYMIEDLKQRVSARHTALKKELDEKSNIISTLNGKITILQQSLADIDAELANLPSREVLEGYVDAASGFINKRKEELASYTTDYSESIREKEAQLSEIKLLETQDVQSITIEFSSKLNDLDTNKKVIEYKLSQKRKELKDAESVIDVCPYCKQKIPDAHKIDTTELNSEIFSLSAELEDAIAELAQTNQEKQLAMSALNEKYAKDKITIETELEELKEQSIVAQNEIDVLQADIFNYSVKLSEYNAQLSRYDELVTELTSKKISTQNSIDSITAEMVYNIDICDNLKDRISINSKFTTVLSRDFRGIILSNIIEYINSRIKSYAKDLFDNDDVSFCLSGNDINISLHNKEYESLSGGEKQKIDLIVQFSLRDMLCQYMNFSCNIIVLDEITDNLDYLGCQKILKLISTKMDDVKNIYIISHRQDLDIPFDHVLKVVKTDNGVSKLNSIM